MFIIFSVSQGNLSPAENDANMVDAAVKLSEKGTFKAITAVYEGIEEQSFITDQENLAKKLIQRYNQDSFLEQGQNGVWYLVEACTDIVIDKFRGLDRVPKAAAIENGSYTIMEGEYYVGSKF